MLFCLSALLQRGVPLIAKAACTAPRCCGTKACVYEPKLYEDCCSAEPTLLHALRVHTEEFMPRAAHMMSGAQQGRLLYMLARLQRAQRVLEVGSFTGYATLWLASALQDGGTLVALERDPIAAEVARTHLQAAGLSERVELCVADALESVIAMPSGQQPFDLIFLDADKKRYVQYYEELLRRKLLAPDGLLIADNILWKWQVLSLAWPAEAAAEAEPAPEALTAYQRRMRSLRDAMHHYNVHVSADYRTRQLLLPLRDGLSVAQLSSMAEGELEGEGEAEAEAKPSARTQAAATDAEGAAGARVAGYMHAAASGEPLRVRLLRGELLRLAADAGRAVHGVAQGRLLHMLARLARAQRILHVGSFIGCATLWMASALDHRGSIDAYEGNKRAAEAARRHLAASGLAAQAQVHVGKADGTTMGVPSAAELYELIVIHADDPEAAVASVLVAAAAIAPHGLIVLLCNSGSGDEPWLTAQRALGRLSGLRVVTIPSPDGDASSLTLCGLPSPLDHLSA